eukprot:TRINITY_DN2177_c0_g1_i2.p1 TRINITY_DN2177_c0_g1~~TRINITY_DN2177_c0_g1_i2.p1  ORF type:complete len:302 (+),score=18.89 TRINITY_DN2177_c0_g1_i2:160-1065(+)
MPEGVERRTTRSMKKKAEELEGHMPEQQFRKPKLGHGEEPDMACSFRKPTVELRGSPDGQDQSVLFQASDEVLAVILRALSLQDAARFGRTCRRAYSLLVDHSDRLNFPAGNFLFFPNFSSQKPEAIGTPQVKLEGADFSFAVWARPTAESGNGIIFGKERSCVNDHQCRLMLMQGYCVLAALGIHQAPSWQLGAPCQDGNGYSTPFFSSEPLPTNAWTHVALVRRGNVMQLFVNGRLDQQQSWDMESHYSNRDFRLGSRCVQFGPGACDFFPGDLCDGVVFDRALSADEVRLLLPLRFCA